MKIYIWGTGKKAESFLLRYGLYTECPDTRHFRVWHENVVGFIDSNKEKQGRTFHQKPIVSCDEAMRCGMELCIISVVKHDEIDRELLTIGFDADEIIYADDYLESCRDEMLKMRFSVLRNQGIVLSPVIEDDLVVIQKSRDNSTRLCDRLMFSLLEDTWIKNGKKESDFCLIRKCYSLSEIVAGMEWKYGNGIEHLSSYFSNSKLVSHKRKSISTIGIYVGRYFGGGIEKVLSLLIPKYIASGYEVVLITDIYEPKKEFSFPKEAIRYNMKNSNEGDFEGRLNEFAYCIEKYQIDVVCFHFGYERITTFYEMLFIKMLGIPVVLTLHSAYQALLNDNAAIADKLPSIYRIADIVVTLSDKDKNYWHNKGLRCALIPNPIEDFGICEWSDRNTEHAFPTVLWVGRIVERPKRVLDAADIIHKVIFSVPNVRLRIVGNRDDLGVYEKLKKKLRTLNIEDYVDICSYSKDMTNVYNDADIVLITSESESYSNVLMESRVHSRPVIMYELPWLYTVKNKGGIIAVPQGDIFGAAGKIVGLLTDNEKWKLYSKEAWNGVLPYLAHDVTEDWEKLFEEIFVNA